MSQTAPAHIHPTLETPRLTLRFFDPARASDYEDLLSVYEAVRAVRDSVALDPKTPADIDRRTSNKSVPVSLLPKSKLPAPTYVWTLIYLKSPSSMPSERTLDQEKSVTSASECVGHVAVFHTSGEDVPKFGYALNPAFWGHGYATEAAQEVLRYYSEDLGLKTIRATAMLTNVASVRVLTKLGGRKIDETQVRRSEGDSPATPEFWVRVAYEWHFGQSEQSPS